MFMHPHSHYIAISVKFSDFVHTRSPLRAQTLMSVCDYAGVFHRILRKIQWKVILPMLLEFSLNPNTSTYMQYVASLLTVKWQFFSSQIFGDRHVFFSIFRMFHFCVTAEALLLSLQNMIYATVWPGIYHANID